MDGLNEVFVLFLKAWGFSVLEGFVGLGFWKVLLCRILEGFGLKGCNFVRSTFLRGKA